jgi:hypothetical protein
MKEIHKQPQDRPSNSRGMRMEENMGVLLLEAMAVGITICFLIWGLFRRLHR